MRYSIALAGLLLTSLVNTTAAQFPNTKCPNTKSNCRRLLAVPAHCPSSLKTAALARPAQVPHGQIPSCVPNHAYIVAQGCAAVQNLAVRGDVVVQSYPMAQSQAFLQSYPGNSYPGNSYPGNSYPGNSYTIQSNNSIQIGSVVRDLSPTHTQVYPQNAPHVPQSNCNCNRARQMPTFSPHSIPQTGSILEHKRNPFSLAGHAREGKPPDLCAAEFFACCDSGGKDCVANYFKCAEITGEPVRHYECPSDGIIDKSR